MSYNYAGGCSSCSGCSTGACSGPGCAAAVTPAGGLKPQVEPNIVNPSNIKPTPNSNYLDQPSAPKTNTPSTFMNEGFGNSGNTNAPGFVPPVNMESKKVPTDATEMKKEETTGSADQNATEMKKEDATVPGELNSAVKKPASTPEKNSEELEEIIKKRQPAPPALPEAGIKNPTLEIPNPAPIAFNIPTVLVLHVEPTRVTRTAKFSLPTVARNEAKILPATFPTSVVAQK
jgi:hypothetical protein